MTKKQVIMFVGQDITSHLIMNKVVADMLAKDVYQPVIFLPKHAPSKRSDVPQLREFGFFDRVLLNETVYPFIEDRPCVSAPYLSPRQLAEKYSLDVCDVADVNDPAFVESLRNNKDIGCAISIRCTQLFREDIVNAIKLRAPFVNLHSGLLPEYRGVMPTLRRMFDIASGNADSVDYGCTLHKVEPFNPNGSAYNGVDTGKIIEVKSLPLNPALSGYQANVGLAEAGADAINGVLVQLQKYSVRGYPQTHESSQYFTFPNQQELDQWEKSGVVLVRKEDVFTTLVDAFSKAGHRHGEKLVQAMEQATKKWYKNDTDFQSNGILIPAALGTDVASETKSGTLAVRAAPESRLAAC
ncbi:MAG: hypothetical protein WC043_08890 [Pseudobdellovibrionaceae bacterium]